MFTIDKGFYDIFAVFLHKVVNVSEYTTIIVGVNGRMK